MNRRRLTICLCLCLTGCTSIGVLDEGTLYSDPQGRFTVIVPDARQLVPHSLPEGVQFVGDASELELGNLFYAVLAYPVTADVPKAEHGLDFVVNWLGEEIAKNDAKMEIIYKKFGHHRGWPSLDLYYHVDKGHTRNLYVSRLVNIDSYIFNMYYCFAGFSAHTPLPLEIVQEHHVPRAEKLYEGTTFLLTGQASM